MTRLLIIPARGGSKRIPRKNMCEFGGQPAVHRTIELAVASNLFDSILVSSDDEDILSSVSKYSVIADSKRPLNLSDDKATVTEVIKYEVTKLKSLGYSFDEIWQLSSFAFLLSVEDLKRFAERAKRLPEDGLLVGILPFPAPIEWALKKDLSGEISAVKEESLVEPSQHFAKYFYDSGAIAVFKSEVFEDSEFQLSDLRLFGEEVNAHKVVDVDEPQDLITLQVLYLGHTEAHRLGLKI